MRLIHISFDQSSIQLTHFSNEFFHINDFEHDNHGPSALHNIYLPDQISVIYLNGDINISYKSAIRTYQIVKKSYL